LDRTSNSGPPQTGQARVDAGASSLGLVGPSAGFVVGAMGRSPVNPVTV
jgi:hypothetical protein